MLSNVEINFGSNAKFGQFYQYHFIIQFRSKLVILIYYNYYNNFLSDDEHNIKKINIKCNINN